MHGTMDFIPQTDVESEEVVPQDCHGSPAVSEAIGGVGEAHGLGTALDLGYDGHFGKSHAEIWVGEIYAGL